MHVHAHVHVHAKKHTPGPPRRHPSSHMLEGGSHTCFDFSCAMAGSKQIMLAVCLWAQGVRGDCESPRQTSLPFFALLTDGTAADLYQALYAHTASLNSLCDDYGFTLLTAASARGDVDVVSELLRRGANIDTRSPHGLTPIMAAASSRSPHRLEVVKVLHSAGAGLSFRTASDGLDAIGIAESKGHADVAVYLRSPPSQLPSRLVLGLSLAAGLVIAALAALRLNFAGEAAPSIADRCARCLGGTTRQDAARNARPCRNSSSGSATPKQPVRAKKPQPQAESKKAAAGRPAQREVDVSAGGAAPAPSSPERISTLDEASLSSGWVVVQRMGGRRRRRSGERQSDVEVCSSVTGDTSLSAQSTVRCDSCAVSDHGLEEAAEAAAEEVAGRDEAAAGGGGGGRGGKAGGSLSRGPRDGNGRDRGGGRGGIGGCGGCATGGAAGGGGRRDRGAARGAAV